MRNKIFKKGLVCAILVLFIGIAIIPGIHAEISKTNFVQKKTDNIPPVADAGGPYNVKDGEVVVLDGSDSYDPDGIIVEWYWWYIIKFGPLATLPIPIGFGETIEYSWDLHPFPFFPVYVSVYLRVTDNDGATDYDETNVIIGKPVTSQQLSSSQSSKSVPSGIVAEEKSMYVGDLERSIQVVLTGTIGENGWYVSDVTITITWDPEEIAEVYYKIDDGEWTLYTEPIVISEDGLHTFYWYCVDGNTLYVGGSGPGNYTKIQDAIDNASDGDTVYVYNGIYTESNILVDKTLNLVGESKEGVIVDSPASLCSFKFMQVSNTNISSFTMKNGLLGIWIEYSNTDVEHINITNCIVHDIRYCGIMVIGNQGYMRNSVIKNCEVYNTMYGIELGGFFDSTISECNLHDNDIGIYMSGGVLNNRIYHNNFIGNIQNAHPLYTGPGAIWDNGYPSGGNYWDDYTGVDYYRGPNQDIPGSDAIGDTSYILDGDEEDRYPLMPPMPNLPPCVPSNPNPTEGETHFKIDQTPPIIELTVEEIYPNKWLFIADVYDATSGVNRVEFYVNDEYVGNVTEHPYEWIVSNPKKGDKGQATVYDNAGNNAVSAEIDAVSQSQSQSSSSSDQQNIPYASLFCESALGSYVDTVESGKKDDLNHRRPILDVEFLGGNRVKITNIGTATAYNVHLKLELQGGFVLIGRVREIVIDEIEPDESVIRDLGRVFGFGRVILVISLWADNAPKVEDSVEGILMGFLLSI